MSLPEPVPSATQPAPTPAVAQEKCLNCGQALTGPYCAGCGQRHRSGAPSLGHVWEEFADDYLHFDSKLPKTLWALVSKPGLLTREYNAGRRASYVGPFKLYVLCSIVFFFSSAVLLPWRLPPPPPPSKAAQKPIIIVQGDDQAGQGGLFGDLERDVKRKLDHKTPAQINRTTRAVIARYAPDGMLVLLPLVALFFKLLTWRRYYAEHFVFALHLHALGYLAFTVVVLSQFPPLNVPLLVAFGVYVLVAFKRVYAQGWVKTVFKLGLVGLAYPTALAFMIAGLALGGVLLGS